MRTGGSPNSLPGLVSPAAPALFTGFPGLLDDYGPTPPDTGGAVGPQDIVTVLNSQVAVQSRTGSLRPKFPILLTQFWGALGPFDKIFDPRILCDPAAGRWIAAASANPGTATAALLVAVSESGDPTGDWRLFEIILGGAGVWADYPVLGLNKTWITLSSNLIDNPPIAAYHCTEVYVFQKAALYQNFTADYTAFRDSTGQFTPATDLDRMSDTMYFLQAIADPAGGRIRVSRLSGPPGDEVFDSGTAVIPAGETWADSPAAGSNFAPQSGSYYKIDTGDSRLQNCVLRNSSIWCTGTVFLPADKPARAGG
jgi:hypothetical protein